MLQSRRSVRCAARCVLMLAAVAPWSAGARGAEPSSHFLPDETLAVVRMPSLEAFGASVKDRTKLGKVLFSDERIARFRQLFEGEGTEQWKELRERLERYQLKPDDLTGLMHGEIGAALTATPRGKDAPLMMALFWAEPEPELADRLYAALEKYVEESQQEETPVRRVDLDLAGHQVMQLRAAVSTREAVEMDEEFPDFNDQAALQRYLEKRAKLQAEAKLIQSDQVNYFITRRENRFLIGITLPNSGSRLNRGEGASNDFDEVSSVEAASEVFGKFLTLHEGPATGLIPRALAAPGIAAALPEGDLWMEAFVDSSALWALLETAPNPNAKSQIEKLGLKGIGPIAYRAALDGNVLRATAMVSAPTPRTGVVTLIEQEPIPAEPADWVPSSALGYAQMSFDLPKFYEFIKQTALAEGGDAATEQFATLERQCQGLFQTDVPALLASLGKRHAVISLMPEIKTAQPGDEDEVGTPPSISNRSAFVWQLGDEELWKRIIKLGASFAGSSNGIMTAAEEQGFTGLRIELPGQQGGVFVGRGYLTLGIGPGVVEQVLAALRSPPALAQSLRGSATYARAAQLLPLEPGLAFQMNDNARVLPMQRTVFLQALEAPFNSGPLAEIESEEINEARALVEKIKELVPTEAELEGILGVGVGHAAVSDQGLIIRTATEMPAP